MPAHPAARAFTLVELMIVIAVVALLAVAAGPAMGGLTGADARKGAGEVAGAMRWLFDAASVRHATCRLAIDAGSRAFWAECAPAHQVVASAAAKEEERPIEAPGDAAGDARALLGGARFSTHEDPVVGRRELPGDVAFLAVRVDGRDALDGGEAAFIHFFPGGRAQAASVTVGEGSHAFTIRLEPFTGRARVSAGAGEGE